MEMFLSHLNKIDNLEKWLFCQQYTVPYSIQSVWTLSSL